MWGIFRLVINSNSEISFLIQSCVDLAIIIIIPIIGWSCSHEFVLKNWLVSQATGAGWFI